MQNGPRSSKYHNPSLEEASMTNTGSDIPIYWDGEDDEKSWFTQQEPLCGTVQYQKILRMS